VCCKADLTAEGIDVDTGVETRQVQFHDAIAGTTRTGWWRGFGNGLLG